MNKSSNKRTSSTEIAVIGMAGKFPGADSLDIFWKNLVEGVESISQFSKEELIMDGESVEILKDKKYVEDAYNRIQTQKIFEWTTTQVKPADKDISADEFTKMVEAHQHHHH